MVLTDSHGISRAPCYSGYSAVFIAFDYKTLTFYGNDAVCLFKYFVKPDDPQRNFSLVIISVNLFCFVVIAAAYSIIAKSARKTSDELTKNNLNKTIKDNNNRLQRVTNAIIFSDFLCWMPFILVCFLHVSDVIDATPWYSVFSILVLPINSVVNPILYDKSFTENLNSFYLDCISIKRHCAKRPDDSRDNVEDLDHEGQIEMQQAKKEECQKKNCVREANIVNGLT